VRQGFIGQEPHDRQGGIPNIAAFLFDFFF
jgi:hypothetical protein